ncbi:SNARE-like domain protein [Helicobacter pylori GAM270ASi]|nr:SNARE-like domain protein [Helicobacter pylori GAM121Aii]EMH20610.1 SNARE-like domain protein [Helicobacter pylori GAM260ASi]EMH21565.1 SNARE-like domain protein [Helicobacter pylori GAM260Bi]EMH28548.1 SNARE-like domain protein [Helicobacter pylori GAM268Bii]EMH30844.1 SNARE-like domain protein [Helicobacter pylori GAM270ASi]EMH64091.1 SNARE-like domain protein [Helicobacter pylori HP260AFi]EMH64526.1 SNARE-like domain protein [Helicobacter pylori HP260AFii]EMH68900.1 SNARE-like domain p
MKMRKLKRGFLMQEALLRFQEGFKEWGYLILFLYSLGGGYVGIVIASILSATTHALDIKITILVAFLGNMVGSGALVVFARYQKREFLKYFHKHRRKLALASLWVKRYAFLMIFVNKYLYGIKSVVPLAIGFSKYPLKRFLWLNVLSSFLWALIVGSVSFQASDWVKTLYERLSHYTSFFVISFALIALLIWFLLKRYSRKMGF